MRYEQLNVGQLVVGELRATSEDGTISIGAAGDKVALFGATAVVKQTVADPAAVTTSAPAAQTSAAPAAQTGSAPAALVATNGSFTALTFSATVVQAEAEALRDQAEILRDDTDALRTIVAANVVDVTELHDELTKAVADITDLRTKLAAAVVDITALRAKQLELTNALQAYGMA